jgi:hypothetical protein
MENDTGHFEPTCAHCGNPIATDQYCFKNEDGDEFYHRKCYHDTHTLECEYCTDPINLNKHTALPTKTGHYHQDCYFKANADEHCSDCSTALVSGQNLRRITDPETGNDVYLCLDCYARQTREAVHELVEDLEDRLSAALEPSREEQERLGLYETPTGWKQDRRDGSNDTDEFT